MNAPTWIRQLRSKREESYASKLRHDERFEALRSVPARRALVIATLLLWLSAVLLLWWDVGAGNAFLLAAVVMLGCYWLVHRAVRLVADAPERASMSVSSLSATPPTARRTGSSSL